MSRLGSALTGGSLAPITILNEERTSQMTSTDTATTLQLAPYIFFGGRCEEALEFYKTVLGGTYEVMRNSDSPMGAEAAENWKHKIMHSSFTAPGLKFMASDGRGPQVIDPEAGNITLALTAPTAEQGKRIFDALADGGKVKMPFDAAFWGGTFGMLDDRFGIEWMVVSDPPA